MNNVLNYFGRNSSFYSIKSYHSKNNLINSEYNNVVCYKYDEIIKLLKDDYMDFLGKGFKINCRDFYIESLRPINISYRDEGDLIIAEISALSICSYGDNKEEARENIIEKLAFIWDEYAEFPNEKMTLGAQKLKEDIKKYFRKY